MILAEYIEKGEAKLIYSSADFTKRNELVTKEFNSHSDIVIFSEEKMKIDTIRDFAYELQKGSTGGIHNVHKLGILICDEIVLSAQNSLLKILEDIDPNFCILIFTHIEAVYIPTINSRVMKVYIEDAAQEPSILLIKGNTVAERLESVKKIMKDFDDEKITKQDIIGIIESIKDNKEVYIRAFSMLKQPSVSVKYVLEYVAVNA